VETAEAKGLDGLWADAASPGRLWYSTGAEGEYQMTNSLAAHPVALTGRLQRIPSDVLADQERIPGCEGGFGDPA
jgi:hypothetical protein